MSVCVDCGGKGSPICGECARIAELLGHTIDERLRALGVPILPEVKE